MTRLLHCITSAFSQVVRLVNNNYSSWLLLCVLHTSLLVAAGYSMVTCSLPLLFKAGLFCLVCLASTCLLYQAMAGSGEKCTFHRN